MKKRTATFAAHDQSGRSYTAIESTNLISVATPADPGTVVVLTQRSDTEYVIVESATLLTGKR